MQTIYLFTSAYPAVLSGANAATLLPYLKNATTVSFLTMVSSSVMLTFSSQAEEQTTSDYLLRIFRASIPHLPKTAAKFGQELQLALQPMILKPSTAAGVLVCHACSSSMSGHLIMSTFRDCKRLWLACVLLCIISLMTSLVLWLSCDLVTVRSVLRMLSIDLTSVPSVQRGCSSPYRNR